MDTMTKKNLRFALAIFFALLSPCLASAALTQTGYADLTQYSGLTKFDMGENGRIYAIADRKGGARLICLDGGGNELASYGVTDGAEEITASPSGGAVFYRVPGAETGGRVYKVTGAGADGFKDGFTFGGIPVAVEKIEAVDDDGILIAWNAEYEEDAEFPDWLPKTVKIGLFSYSAAGEPEEVWTWTPQWLPGETNFDGNPYVKRLGDSWRYYLSFNPGSRDIFVYATHYRKFFHEPTGRNHYSRNVTHIYIRPARTRRAAWPKSRTRPSPAGRISFTNPSTPAAGYFSTVPITTTPGSLTSCTASAWQTSSQGGRLKTNTPSRGKTAPATPRT